MGRAAKECELASRGKCDVSTPMKGASPVMRLSSSSGTHLEDGVWSEERGGAFGRHGLSRSGSGWGSVGGPRPREVTIFHLHVISLSALEKWKLWRGDFREAALRGMNFRAPLE